MKGPPTYETLLEAMVTTQIAGRGIVAPEILAAFRNVPRHPFVGAENRHLAYRDCPLPIGSGQTISQPYIVARMLWLLSITHSDTVLEIGTGSGYQTALLSLLARFVYSIEVDAELARSAEKRLQHLGYQHIEIHQGNGKTGLLACAPFDKIIASCAAPTLPMAWIDQLKKPGQCVAPVGNPDRQTLIKAEKNFEGNVRVEEDVPCVFVPLV